MIRGFADSCFSQELKERCASVWYSGGNVSARAFDSGVVGFALGLSLWRGQFLYII
jgi:hypothetical protein